MWTWARTFDGILGSAGAMLCFWFAIQHFFYPDRTREKYYAAVSRPELYTEGKVKLMGLFFAFVGVMFLFIGAYKIGLFGGKS